MWRPFWAFDTVGTEAPFFPIASHWRKSSFADRYCVITVWCQLLSTFLEDAMDVCFYFLKFFCCFKAAFIVVVLGSGWGVIVLCRSGQVNAVNCPSYLLLAQHSFGDNFQVQGLLWCAEYCYHHFFLIAIIIDCEKHNCHGSANRIVSAPAP